MLFMFCFGGLSKRLKTPIRNGKIRNFPNNFFASGLFPCFCFLFLFFCEGCEGQNNSMTTIFSLKTLKWKKWRKSSLVQIKIRMVFEPVTLIVWFEWWKHNTFISMVEPTKHKIFGSLLKNTVQCVHDKPTMFKHYESKWKFLISKHVEYKINVKNPDSKRSQPERECERWRECGHIEIGLFADRKQKARTHFPTRVQW